MSNSLQSVGGKDAGQYVGTTVVRRLANVLKSVDLDCDCHGKLDAALARFEALEVRRTAREQLGIAHQQRDRIEAVLYFLRDLDELVAMEHDHSAYTDIALLFDDIAAAAREGSSAMRRLAEAPAASAMP